MSWIVKSANAKHKNPYPNGLKDEKEGKWEPSGLAGLELS
jgi:hypothetical protein